MRIQKLILTFLFTICIFYACAQTCTNLGQTSGTAFPVCGGSVFSQTNVPICGNTVIPTPCPGAPNIYQDKNPYWYKFTCFSTGTFSFLITPNNLADDYDWQLFDITNRAAGDVYTDPTLFVACNWSGESGQTGASNAGTSLVNCGGFGVPLFSSMPTLIQGHTYLLLVSHFTNSQSGYDLSFGGGSAVITDTSSPHLASASATCDGKKVIIKLNKKMKCRSLASDGSDFIIAGNPGIISSVSGTNCTSGFDMDSLVLTLSSPLIGGNYTVVVQNGSDGNTLLDICDAAIPVNESLSFTIFPSQPPAIDSITDPACKPNTLQVVMNMPVRCNSVAPNGSDFKITGPSSVSITAATINCINSFSSLITLQLNAPVIKGGIYQLQINKGNDSNTLINQCGQEAVAGITKTFVIDDTVSAAFTYNIKQGCDKDTVSFFHNGNNGVNNWLWTFDNTSTSILQNPVRIYNTFGNHIIKLIVSANNCSDSFFQTINLPSRNIISTTTSQVSTTCGKNNGSAQVTASGGTGGFTYLWTPGNFTTATINNLSPGKYFVTITDSLGCKKIDSIQVTSLPVPMILSINKTNITCFGVQNGTATANVTGGLQPYTFTWTHGSVILSGNPLLSLDTGKYTLVVTDARGCKDTSNFLVTQPSNLTHTTSVKSTSCGLANGSATVNVTGGTKPFSYIWSPVGGNNASATNLPAGNYVVNILDSNNCRDTAHINILASNPLTATTTTTNVSCLIGNNGSATVLPNGNPPYTYQWSPTGGNNATATGLSAGNYFVKVTDTLGCTDTFHVQIKVADPLTLQITNARMVTCFGGNNGSATVVANGIGPFVYNWITTGTITATTNNLSAGNHIVLVTDGNGCTVTDSVTITQPPPISIAITKTNTTCGLNNGAASVVAGGGSGNLSYNWMPGNLTTSIINNLSPGNYTVTVTDTNGCIKTDSAVISTVVPPNILRINSSDVLCFGGNSGSATAIITNGTPAYSYNWSGNSITSTDSSFNNLTIGKYYLEITDSSGCKDLDSFIISQPSPLSLSYSVEHTSCGKNNGSAKVLVSGGIIPYTYTWSNGSSKDSATSLQPGNYGITVKDANDCLISQNDITIQNSNGFSISLGNERSICPGMELLLTPGNFTSYKWHNGSDSSTYKVSTAELVSVTVTDQKGCSAYAEVKINDKCNDIVFPSAFTPNNDNLNDYFGPIGTLLAIADYNLRIYNRWGQLIFTSNDPYKKWDGKSHPPGTYVWFAEYIFNGQPKKNQKGVIVLIK